MKTTFYLITILLFAFPGLAQTSSRQKPIKTVNWTDEQDQTGGIDLLQKSTKDESISVGRESPAVRTPADLINAQRSASAKAAADSADMLDIPLDMGNNSSVQTKVKPTASPKRAQAVQKQLDKSTSKTAPQTTAPSTTVRQTTVQTVTQQTQTQEATPATPETTGAVSPEGEDTAVTSAADDSEEAAADAELEYAVRLLEKSREDASAGRAIPPSAAKNRPATVPAANKKFNPNAYRPGVEWTLSKSKHFDIYTQKATSGPIGSANMAMIFESSYQTLLRFIPWMMANRVRVFVYQDHNAYLKYEPEAKAWTHALAYPTRGEIVVYDEPNEQQALKEVFTHELTHIFTQQFFDKHKTGRIMTPTWLDEGLAVLVEDQAYSGTQGGPWNHDYQTLNLQRDPSQQMPAFGSRSMFGFGSSFGSNKSGRSGFGRNGPPVQLMPFEEFMKEGSLEAAEGQNKMQKWYLQSYLMVRFLLNNRMRFEQFTRLLAEGEPMRNPTTGFLVRDNKGKTVYQPYSTEKALGRAYHYNNTANFEDSFWRWLDK